jgi:hypothetical protein
LYGRPSGKLGGRSLKYLAAFSCSSSTVDMCKLAPRLRFAYDLLWHLAFFVCRIILKCLAQRFNFAVSSLNCEGVPC